MNQCKIIMCRGLPGSGKSTWAKQYQAEHPGTIRVNKDELRATLHDSVYSKGKENFVLAVRNFIVDKALTDGHDVIVDDTNFHEKHLDCMLEIAEKHNVIVKVQSFCDVPLETCIQRDLQRPKSVGERVIRQMHRQFLETKPTPLVYNPSLRNCIIVDLDGTLALFDRDKVSPYDRYFLADQVNEAVRDILLRSNDSTYIIVFSGRKDTFMEQTVQWLVNNNIPYDELHMRKSEDRRKDAIVKEELYNEHINDKYNVMAVIDDRLNVCRLWYKLGLPLFRVGDPDADF